MRSAGYTLIELLVVISIISILSVVGFVNFKDFSSDQVAVKAVGQVQTYLRLAQSNATSSTICPGQGGATSWSVVFTNDAKTIQLRCNPNDFLKRIYSLDPAQVSSIRGSDCGSDTAINTTTRPLTITYLSGVGTLAFSTTDTNTSSCLQSSTSITIRLSNTKSLTLNKGGAINVQ